MTRILCQTVLACLCLAALGGCDPGTVEVCGAVDPTATADVADRSFECAYLGFPDGCTFCPQCAEGAPPFIVYPGTCSCPAPRSCGGGPDAGP